MDDISRQISGYDREYTTAEGGGGRRPGIESLKDGWYTFIILDAESALVGDDKTPIVRLGLKVEGDGDVVEHVYWLQGQVAVNILGCDLKTLGFPADTWGGRFSRELMALLKSGQLVGHRFKGKKVTEKGQKKDFHKLYVNWGLGKKAAAPAVAGSTQARQPAQQTQAANTRRPAAQPAVVFDEPGDDGGDKDGEEIPF